MNTQLTIDQASGHEAGDGAGTYVRPEAGESILSAAELTECQCPDFCERDHDRD